MGECQEIAAGAARSAFSGASQHNRLMRLDFPFKDGPFAILLPNKLVAHEEVSRRLRRSIWHRLTGGQIDGEDGSRKAVQVAFDKWVQQADNNREMRLIGKSMQGFILPFEDNRSSTIRLG